MTEEQVLTIVGTLTKFYSCTNKAFLKQLIMAQKQKARDTVIGTVVSDKMDKTITVRVDRTVEHSQYGKYLKRSSKIKAHDEEEQASEGDKVEIAETRPLSKTKSWYLVDVVEQIPEQ